MPNQIVRGVDVHAGKGPINWSLVRANGREFAFIKCTEGATFDDPLYKTNVATARKAGLRVGSYHFARPDHNSPQTEVAHFLSKLDFRPGDILPALDFEVGPPSTAWALAFLKLLEQKLGVKGFFYSYPDFIHRMRQSSELAQYPLWYASYTRVSPSAPAPWNKITVWQHSSDGYVKGIAGKADQNALMDGVALDSITFQPSKPEPVSEPLPPQGEPTPDFYTQVERYLKALETPLWVNRAKELPPMWAWFVWRDHGAPKEYRPVHVPRVIPPTWWARYVIHRGK